MTTHSKVELNDLVDAIETAVSAIPGSVIELDEGISDNRTIQVYSSEFEGAHGSRTQVNTFGGGLQKRRYVIKIDVFSQPRANVGEDITAAQADAYSVIEILEAQTDNPPFGLSGVHTFHWTGKLGILPYGGAEYWGSSFELEFMCH